VGFIPAPENQSKAIVRKIEYNEIPETIEVRGSSYFFSATTASKLGFNITGSGIFEKSNIMLNCLDLFWMYSLSKGRLVLPRLHEVKTVSTSGAILTEKKEVLLQLQSFLNKQGGGRTNPTA